MLLRFVAAVDGSTDVRLAHVLLATPTGTTPGSVNVGCDLSTINCGLSTGVKVPDFVPVKLENANTLLVPNVNS